MSRVLERSGSTREALDISMRAELRIAICSQTSPQKG